MPRSKRMHGTVLKASPFQREVFHVLRASIVGVFSDNGFSNWDNLLVKMYTEDALDQGYSLRMVVRHAQAACEVVNKPRGCTDTVWPPEIHHLVSAVAHADYSLVKETEGIVHVS